MSKETGGPAFPHWDGPSGQCISGLTIRDYFAAKALPVWVQAQIDQSVDDLSGEDIARECYRYADRMLIERAK